MFPSDEAAQRLVPVHGATSGPWVFEPWAGLFSTFDVRVPDLQTGLVVARARVADYAAQVIAASGGPGAVMVGWSMGGLPHDPAHFRRARCPLVRDCARATLRRLGSSSAS